MAVTKQEILAALNVTEQQFDAFMQRGILLTNRDAIDSAIRNVEKARDAALLEFQQQIETLQEQRKAVQAQIDAL